MEQQPVPQNFFQKNKLPLGISSVVLVFLIIGGIYFFENKLTQPTANPISDTENNTKASTPQM